MVINTNTAASRGARFLADSTSNLQKSLARLSSGSKIVSPQDDAAGLAVASKFDAQINRTEAVRSNIGNSISFKQTQDGYLAKVQKALDRMSELTTLASDDSKSASDIALYGDEYTKLGAYIDNIATQSFNGVSLFSGSTYSVLVDDTGSSGEFAMAGISFSSSSGVGSYTTITGGWTTASAASSHFSLVKSAIETVAGFRSAVGANLSRLNMTDEHLSVLAENLSASVSRIKDVDVAEESARYSKYNILVQSGTAMLAQANSLPQSALRLLS